MRRSVMAAAFLLASAGAGAGVWWLLPREAERPVGVVIITLDTTRVDRLSPYGFMDTPMPALDRLAREGVVFDQAISVAPLTLPAHCSIFTGNLPPTHRVRDNGDRALGEEQTTLAEVLRAQGFRTAAFVASTVLDADRGLAQGFERYVGVDAESGAPRRQRRADEVVGESVEWLEGLGDSPFLLWTHLYDPHRPYDPPAPFDRMHDPYVGEIAFADSQIERLLAALDRRRLLDRAIVIVAGDHGESLGEHGERDHGIFVYESVLRVPLIIRAPGIPPRRVGAVTRLTDVMPTVLDLLGMPLPQVDGVSARNVMLGNAVEAELEAYSESLYPQRFGWSPLRALRDGRFKYIEAPRPELYDLERDPFELRNIHAERRPLAAAMAARLASFDIGEPEQKDAAQPVPSADLQARLASVGYLAGDVLRRVVPGEALPDPKDCIGLVAQLGDADGASIPPPPSRPRDGPRRRSALPGCGRGRS